MRICLGHVTNTNDFPKRFKPATIESFGNDISQLVVNGHKRKRYCSRLNKIMNELMSDVYVLGPRMLKWILGDINGTSIVAMNFHGILCKAIIWDKLLHLEQLSATATDVFYISNGQRKKRLFLTQPCH
jgi:hypothetical protein